MIPYTTPFKGYSIDFFVKDTYLQQGKTSDGLFHGFYGWTRRENAKRQNIAGLLQTALYVGKTALWRTLLPAECVSKLRESKQWLLTLKMDQRIQRKHRFVINQSKLDNALLEPFPSKEKIIKFWRCWCACYKHTNVIFKCLPDIPCFPI